jgi:hypothetical protein
VFVVEQVCIALSQTRSVPPNWPQAAYFLPVHCTHWFACGVAPGRHTFLPAICEQSASAKQGTQVFAVALPATVSHFDAAAALQSLFARQATQAFVEVLHCDLAAFVQWVLFKHSTQTLFVVSQAVFPGTPVQSALVLHCTQEFVVVLQNGVAPPQWVFAVQPTQVFVAEQAGVGAAQ